MTIKKSTHNAYLYQLFVGGITDTTLGDMIVLQAMHVIY